ncbi:hypothetical protein C8Q76DRAFT_4264 [Earliella scabrosa]|nr:hypothetical protein C8Q76DRAFT_4264 [Earliella scabrosa]
MDSPQASTSSVNGDGSSGALLIGTAVGLAIYGVTVHQMCLYFGTSAARKDSIQLKIYVVIIFILDTFSSIVTMHISYFRLVSSHRDPSVLDGSLATWSVHESLSIGNGSFSSSCSRVLASARLPIRQELHHCGGHSGIHDGGGFGGGHRSEILTLTW